MVVQTPTSVHLLLGNPSGATPDLGNGNNYLIVRSQYALSYSDRRKIPNWVSWQLNRSWLGSTDRRNNFRPDPDLPGGWEKVTPVDYRDGEYDRGHMIPSGDRTASPEDNSATFLMTNIVPQTPDNNQGPWRELEEYCRYLALRGQELYIVSGTAGRRSTIGKNRVVVPARLWKIVVVLDEPGTGLRGITPNTRVMAVDMPNIEGIRNRNWRTYYTTVDRLEQLTGYDFLSTVDPKIQQVIEARQSS
ncbi:DNA/RNA non-specific endonuclease [Leptolyngbya sp. 'hensonii']|uniref:DNA/RNA non-specific endonuclease n=1 Tax=Leptolyngbya sp. 'hensonii' TaxID=1922337 RepID=UPI001C0B4C48|nr:DNA/RNA non-specific endonuclease [Leptolyngbya sp. 'hensonii']